MILIFFSANKLYLNKENEIYNIESDNLEIDFEDIIFEYSIEKKEKVIIILDMYMNEINYYINLLKIYKLKIYKIYFIKDILLENIDQLIYMSNNRKIYLNEEEEKILDFNEEDNIDLTGISVINLEKDIEKILEMAKKTKVKNYYTINYFKREYIFILIFLFIFFNYIISYKIFNKSYLINDNNRIEEKILNIKREIEILNLDIKKGKEEEIEDNFYTKLEKYNIKKILDKILYLNKNYFYFYSIGVNKKEILLEGICQNLETLNKNINNYEIIYLKNENNYLHYNIKIQNTLIKKLSDSELFIENQNEVKEKNGE